MSEKYKINNTNYYGFKRKDDIIDVLENLNEYLEDPYCENDKGTAQLFAEQVQIILMYIIYLQQRIDKGIEKITSMINLEPANSSEYDYNCNELLSILQGKEIEERNILNKLQNSINKLNDEERTYAVLVKRDLYLLLNAKEELCHKRTILMDKPMTTYYGVIVEIDNTIENDFKTLTKKEYDDWKLNKE